MTPAHFAARTGAAYAGLVLLLLACAWGAPVVGAVLFAACGAVAEIFLLVARTDES